MFCSPVQTKSQGVRQVPRSDDTAPFLSEHADFEHEAGRTVLVGLQHLVHPLLKIKDDVSTAWFAAAEFGKRWIEWSVFDECPDMFELDQVRSVVQTHRFPLEPITQKCWNVVRRGHDFSLFVVGCWWGFNPIRSIYIPAKFVTLHSRRSLS